MLLSASPIKLIKDVRYKEKRDLKREPKEVGIKEKHSRSLYFVIVHVMTIVSG